MMNIVSIVGSLLCLDTIHVEAFCYLLSIIPLKQLSGYSYWRTFLKIIAAFVLLFIAIIVISFIGAIIFGMLYTAG